MSFEKRIINHIKIRQKQSGLKSKTKPKPINKKKLKEVEAKFNSIKLEVIREAQKKRTPLSELELRYKIHEKLSTQSKKNKK